ncbi:hypothetical protein BC832DRAFT_556550 [Gaertneriomyces semiglobifer]|nr:hypothetical protein BC832DRAFT_556550 [Gaertneriomyces semiglobifer]
MSVGEMDLRYASAGRLPPSGKSHYVCTPMRQADDRTYTVGRLVESGVTGKYPTISSSSVTMMMDD